MLETIYEPMAWVLTAGRTGALRQATLAAAGVGRGDELLDVGSATGALTLAAGAVVGPDGRAVGVELSEPMLARARRQAASTPQVEFLAGRAENLPAPDLGFDAVVLSLVLHYLSPEGAAQAIREACRVRRPGGRIVVVDFARSTTMGGRLRAHLMLHGRAAASAPDFGELLAAEGLTDVTSLPSPVPGLAVIRATR